MTGREIEKNCCEKRNLEKVLFVKAEVPDLSDEGSACSAWPLRVRPGRRLSGSEQGQAPPWKTRGFLITRSWMQQFTFSLL